MKNYLQWWAIQLTTNWRVHELKYTIQWWRIVWKQLHALLSYTHWIMELRILKFLSSCVTGGFSKIRSHIHFVHKTNTYFMLWSTTEFSRFYFHKLLTRLLLEVSTNISNCGKFMITFSWTSSKFAWNFMLWIKSKCENHGVQLLFNELIIIIAI